MIIALDDMGMAEAMDVVLKTRTYANTYKIGSSMFMAHGQLLLKELAAHGVGLFLDLKFHDIPMQVERAVESALSYAPDFITVHALGGPEMLRRVARVARGSRTRVLAVTILTSLKEQDYLSLGFSHDIAHGVKKLADLALSCGINGLVSSPHEIKPLREGFGSDCFLVCPGIRSAFDDVGDQSRVTTPREAIKAGADALVIGRSITKARNVMEAAKKMYEEIRSAHEMSVASVGLNAYE